MKISNVFLILLLGALPVVVYSYASDDAEQVEVEGAAVDIPDNVVDADMGGDDLGTVDNNTDSRDSDADMYSNGYNSDYSMAADADIYSNENNPDRSMNADTDMYSNGYNPDYSMSADDYADATDVYDLGDTDSDVPMSEGDVQMSDDVSSADVFPMNDDSTMSSPDGSEVEAY